MAAKRGRMTSQLSVGYRAGPLTVEARGGLAPDTLRAGDRAPDAVCQASEGTGSRIFDILRGPQFTLLAVDRELPTLPGEVRTYRARNGAVGEVYGEGLFLVRPDGYVGLATHDPADVHAYLATVGLG